MTSLAFMNRTDRMMFLAPILSAGIQALRVVCLMGGVFILAALPAYPQAVLEDWASLRSTGSRNLWEAQVGKDQCFNQTLSAANNKGVTQIAGCHGSCVESTDWSCLYTTFQPPNYDWPTGWTQNYVKSGTWDPLFN